MEARGKQGYVSLRSKWGLWGFGSVLSFGRLGAPSLVDRDRGPGVDFLPSFLPSFFPPSIVGLDPSEERSGGVG